MAHLQQFLDANDLSRRKFADRYSDRGLSFYKVRRWARGECLPADPRDYDTINEVTAGQVTAADMIAFYNTARAKRAAKAGGEE